jgi:hypothetical protein
LKPRIKLGLAIKDSAIEKMTRLTGNRFCYILPHRLRDKGTNKKLLTILYRLGVAAGMGTVVPIPSPHANQWAKALPA